MHECSVASTICTPPTLRQNFRLMEATFGRGLNHNSERNTGAELGGGTDRISHSRNDTTDNKVRLQTELNRKNI